MQCDRVSWCSVIASVGSWCSVDRVSWCSVDRVS